MLGNRDVTKTMPTFLLDRLSPVEQYRTGAIDAEGLGFECFVTGDIVTDPRDEVPELLDAIRRGKIAADQVPGEVEWWAEWGERMHEALVSFDFNFRAKTNAVASERLREHISQRLCAESDYEGRVLLMEAAVDALAAVWRVELADSLNALLKALKAFDRDCLPDVEPEDYGLNLTVLPTFGGAAPADTAHIYSWDEMRVLWRLDGKWAIGARAAAS